MKTLQAKNFPMYMAYRELVKFIADNKIGKEDIIQITQFEKTYTLFYYSEND